MFFLVSLDIFFGRLSEFKKKMKRAPCLIRGIIYLILTVNKQINKQINNSTGRNGEKRYMTGMTSSDPTRP